MRKFFDLRVVAQNGLEAPYDHSDCSSPYHPDWYDNKVARTVRQSGVRRVRWEFNGETKEVSNTFLGGIVLDAASGLLVVKAAGKLIAVNPEGSINHEVILPKFVVLTDAGNPLEYHPINDVLELVESNGRALVGLRFRNDRVERRYYDPGTQSWQERDHIYRQ